MLSKIFLVAAIAVAGFLAWVATRDPHYVIERSATMRAPAEKVFPYLVSARKAEEWMPWKEQDPGVKMNYAGPESGVGSKSEWKSDGQMGEGSATVTSVEPNQRVDIALAYTKPMAMSQRAQYLVRQEGENTVVTWRVEGENTFPGRVACAFLNMDKLVGTSFEKGLLNLKSLVEEKK